MTTLLKLRRGQYELVEGRVHPTAVVAGQAVREMALPPQCVLVAVVHTGRAAALAAVLGEAPPPDI